jgi:hypothetical protein
MSTKILSRVIQDFGKIGLGLQFKLSKSYKNYGLAATSKPA